MNLFLPAKINSQPQRIVFLSKNMLFPKKTVAYVIFMVKFSLNMQKKSGGSEKGEVWNLQLLIVPLNLVGMPMLLAIHRSKQIHMRCYAGKYTE